MGTVWMISYEEYERLRNEKGLNNAEVARRASIPPSTFTDWKQGKSFPKNDKLIKIAKALDVDPAILIDLISPELQPHYYQALMDQVEHYHNSKTAEIAQAIFDSKEMRILFDAAKNSKPEDLQMAADLLQRLKGTNPDG